MEHKTLTRNGIINALKAHHDELQKYSVKRMGLFGSYAKGASHKGSDIDLIVEFEEPTFDNFLNLTSYLQNLFGKKVELLTREGVKSIRVKAVAESIEGSVIYVR